MTDAPKVKCTCPTFEGVGIHYDSCPNALHVTNAEVAAFTTLYGPLSYFPDDDESVDTYNERFTFFIHGRRSVMDSSFWVLLRDIRAHRMTLDACNPELIHRIDAVLAKETT